MAKIRAVLRNKTPQGKRAIKIRVSSDGDESYESTGYFIEEKYWDKNRGRVIKHPDASYLNTKISEKESALETKMYDLERQGARILASAITGKKYNHGDFISIFQKHIDTNKGKLAPGTIDRMQSVLNKLKTFRATLSTKELTLDFISLYEKELRRLGNQDGTIRSNMITIQTIFNASLQSRKLPNPFIDYEFPKESQSFDYLEESDVDNLESENKGLTEKQDIYRKMFLLACLNCGLRVSDLLLLEKKHIREDKILKTALKNNKLPFIPIFKRGRAILDSLNHKGRFVFPILPDDLDTSDKDAVDNEISRRTTLYNNALKVIALKYKLGRHISSHLARHTFATMALNRGLSLEYVASLLGISVKQAGKYAKIVNKSLEKAAREAFD